MLIGPAGPWLVVHRTCVDLAASGDKATHCDGRHLSEISRDKKMAPLDRLANLTESPRLVGEVERARESRCVARRSEEVRSHLVSLIIEAPTAPVASNEESERLRGLPDAEVTDLSWADVKHRLSDYAAVGLEDSTEGFESSFDSGTELNRLVPLSGKSSDGSLPP